MENLSDSTKSNAKIFTNTSVSIISADIDGKCCKAGQQDAWKIHANNNNNSLELTTSLTSKETTEMATTADQQQKQLAAVTINNTKEIQQGNAQTKRWNCESCDTATAAVALVVGVGAAVSCNKQNNEAAPYADVAANAGSTRLDEGGGKVVGEFPMSTTQLIMDKQQHLQQNGAVTAITTPLSAPSNQQQTHAMLPLATPAASIEIPKPAAAAVDSINFDAYCAGVAGAASLTPPGGGCGAGNSQHSNRSDAASINNSTENLSYSSENFYPDDLILLEDDDDDVEAEEISLNSDDCMYAYRGDGADFDLTLDAITRRGGGAGDAGLIDDETDFLEMDFEPDPLSEVEYGSVELAPPHADAFLLQRDSCHLSGRHSATTMSLHATPTTTSSATARHQLFSSPIDDELPPPPQTLQSQAMLSKNFACITLHLDQIKGGENGDCDVFECTRSDRASVLGISSSDIVDSVAEAAASATTVSHSLPNALLASFGREMREDHEIKTTPSKITGAKPKRLSTFSTSSSTSSKNSSKSRTSLRSSFAPALCNSSSFDERSVSCTEFRSAPPTTADDCVSSSNVIVIANTCDDFNANDETCLDCLESEFLANTIGKVMDPNACAKCRSKHSSSIAIYARAEQAAQAQARCRSGSPLFFGSEVVRGSSSAGDECIFKAANEFLNSSSAARKKEKDSCWTTPIKNRTSTTTTAAALPLAATDVGGSGGAMGDVDMTMMLKSGSSSNSNGGGGGGGVGVVNQRTATCDNFIGSDGGGEHLLKNLLLTDKEIVTISTMNLNEEALVQALDKLHISYNVDLIKAHFYKQQHHHSSSANLNRHVKEFQNLKHFILHESKKNCNHPKLKLLIEMATRHQVEVQFKKDTNITKSETVCVKVDDILHQWTRTKNLELLKQLDKRFMDANVLGKIAYVIRQAQQRSCAPKRPIPEYISIPQYYPSGYLNLTKKC